MITDCICPDCGKYVEDWWEHLNNEDWYDNGFGFYREYFVHCGCGCKFYYTEYLEVIETKIEKMIDKN